MGEITSSANVAFRDFETFGVPASGPHDPDKAAIRNTFAVVEDQVDALVGVVTSGRKAYATWTDLAATTATAGSVAEVVPSDTGTHTDPVVGGTVDNSGIFSYSTSPAGWRRLYDFAAPSQLVLLDHDAGSTANALKFVPLKGVPTNETLFVVTATEAHDTGAVTVEIAGLNSGAPYELIYADGLDMPRKAFKVGEPLLFRYDPTISLKFILISPPPARVDFVPLIQENVDPATFLCRMRDGAKPYSFGLRSFFTLTAPADRQLGEFGGVTLEIDGVNTADARQVRYYPGDPINDQIGTYAWKAGDVLLFGPLTAGGWFPLIWPPRPASASDSALSNYEKIALRGAGQNAASALHLASL